MMILINIAGLGLIALIIWWFWVYKPVEVEATRDDKIQVIVNNGIYQPARIKVKVGEPAIITFLRQDNSACASMVIFPDAEVSEELLLNEEKTVVLPPMKAGEYPFHCQMQMYRGTLIVE
ncbi:cupredoxin domain-containing protein [Thalassotalea piscium]